ncbi:cyclic nucleotide-binding domain-containing protein [Rhodoferax sp.]|uniref:cyclic nucleotide-binding domain-containing protein n=1 Tax=Rhodoferax sp. TaxID=50421 RepID=UPI00260BEB8C|nr:cyclic nucleotide-binding domain-containing protein [Rhodoferax sp.]MDD2811562.1 cyclic nucleotide-binding domain-containing protein [Rhodoferax sp.]
MLAIPVGVIAGLFLLQALLMVDPLFKQQLWRVLNKPRIQSAGVADLGFWITLVITLAGVVGNLIWACFLGVGLSCLVILRRVSGSLTSRWVYLDQCRSRRVRSLSDVAALERSAHQVAVLALSGHLFFGNSARLTQLVDELHPAVCAVVVDISQLEDVDPSGLEALHRLLRALLERQLRVVLSGEEQVAVPDLQQLLPQNQDLVRSIDQDRGLEFCEDLLLSQLQPASNDPGYVSCAHNLLLLGLDEAGVQLVRALGEVRELQMAQDLFRCHDTADGIWLLEQGRVSILSGAADKTRLATLGPGQFVGEMGFVDQQSRSATARAETPIKAVFLSHAKLLGLTQQQPEVALNLALNIARAISLRMRNSVFR